MKTAIQHCESKAWWTPGGWSADRDQAMVFESSTLALEYCVTHGLAEVLLVMQFSDPKFDIYLELNPTTTPNEDSSRKPEELG